MGWGRMLELCLLDLHCSWNVLVWLSTYVRNWMAKYEMKGKQADTETRGRRREREGRGAREERRGRSDQVKTRVTD